jgi:uncharacterized cupin superfamily protein
MNIIHSHELQWSDALTRGAYAQRRKALGQGAISSGLWELPPGKKSFPLHVHLVTEEALFVISGTAKVRTPAGETALVAGDWVTFPPGGEAHQLINDGAEPFVYLGLSASKGVDVVQYPESGKVAASVGSGPAGKRFVFREDSQVDYFHGDKDS